MRFHTFAFICFLLIKAWGTLFVAWSWLWVLIPEVPLIWLLLIKLGML